MYILFFVTCFFFFKSNQKANHSQMYKKMTMFKKFYVQKVCMKNPFSLFQWSNYPSSICKTISKKFCSKNLFAILAKFSSICEILAMFKKNSMALKYLKRTGQFKVFGFFHGYFINTDFFCHFYTSSNDQPVALTRAQILKNKEVTKEIVSL